MLDVEDCCSGAEHLVYTQKVDAKRLCIDGGSAGGYTTLACLCFKHTFKAGQSLPILCSENDKRYFHLKSNFQALSSEEFLIGFQCCWCFLSCRLSVSYALCKQEPAVMVLETWLSWRQRPTSLRAGIVT